MQKIGRVSLNHRQVLNTFSHFHFVFLHLLQRRLCFDPITSEMRRRERPFKVVQAGRPGSSEQKPLRLCQKFPILLRTRLSKTSEFSLISDHRATGVKFLLNRNEISLDPTENLLLVSGGISRIFSEI